MRLALCCGRWFRKSGFYLPLEGGSEARGPDTFNQGIKGGSTLVGAEMLSQALYRRTMEGREELRASGGH